jgi:hypothetical protein
MALGFIGSPAKTSLKPVDGADYVDTEFKVWGICQIGLKPEHKYRRKAQ